MKEFSPLQPAVYQCANPDCSLRFPSATSLAHPPLCPRCKSPTHRVPSQSDVADFHLDNPAASGPHLEVLLDNIRSTFNVGAMFRTADGVGVQRLHLCGITPLPDNPKVVKTALGAELSVPWTYAANGLTAARELKACRFHFAGTGSSSGCHSPV